MTTYAEATALAGASIDVDPDAWHATRAMGLTATQVRDLVLKGATYRAELLAIKRGETSDDFAGNRYTDWGRAREDALAPVLLGAGIQPEARVFHAADNPRFLASPDGIGVEPLTGDVVVAEIKTSKRDLDPAGEHFASTGYYDQMQWQLRVMQAQRCLFVWEQHDDHWVDGAPTALPFQTRWVERDDERIAYLEQVALDFLAELDGAAPFTQRELASIRVQADAMAYHRAAAKKAETKLRDLIAGRPISQTLASKRFDEIAVAYSAPKLTMKTTRDEALARDEHPDIWAQLEAAQAAWEQVADTYKTQQFVRSTGRLTVKEH